MTTAESAADGLALLRDRAFEAIVSDFMMPEMNGILFLRQVRLFSDIPFILFTGKGREEVVIDAINSGADFYLQKGGDPSVQFAELGHKILQAVSRRKAERALRERLKLIRQTSITSTRFIRLPDDEIDGAVNDLLAEIGTQAGADHCYIALADPASGTVSFAYEWGAPGSQPLREMMGTVDPELFAEVSRRIRSFDLICIPRVSDMPEDTEASRRQRTFLVSLGIKSYLLLPLMNGPVVIGALGFDTTRKEVPWPDEDIDIYKICGQIIASAIARKAADKAISDSEQLYRTVFESTGTAMMILEEDKTVAVVNRELERISGMSRTEIEGRVPWTRFVAPEDMEKMKQYHVLRRSNPTAVPKNYEFNFLASGGKRIGTYITVEMIPGTKKSVVSLIDISREQAARRELIDSEEKFRGLAESLPEGIYMIQENRFVYANPALARIFGYTVDELLALPDFIDLFLPEDQPRIRKAISDRLAGIQETSRYTVRGSHRSGAILEITIHGSRTRYKGEPAIIGTLTAGSG